MKGTTHLLIGMFLGLILPSEYRLFTLSFTIIGSLLPDIDTSSSISHQTIRLSLLRHRGITHSLWIPLILFLMLIQYSSLSFIILPFLFGILSHIFLDGITPSGIRLFYPLGILHVQGTVRSGGVVEFVLQGVLLFLIMITVVLKLGSVLNLA